jgi:hypothetical protein
LKKNKSFIRNRPEKSGCCDVVFWFNIAFGDKKKIESRKLFYITSQTEKTTKKKEFCFQFFSHILGGEKNCFSSARKLEKIPFFLSFFQFGGGILKKKLSADKKLGQEKQEKVKVRKGTI